MAVVEGFEQPFEMGQCSQGDQDMEDLMRASQLVKSAGIARFGDSGLSRSCKCLLIYNMK